MTTDGGTTPMTTSDPERVGVELVALLEQQRALYEELDALSARQSALITNQDTDALLSVLSERERIVHRLQTVSEHIEPYRQDWSSLLGRLSPALRERVEHRLDELSALLERISARDEADRAALVSQRDDVAHRLEGVSRGRSAVGAYGKGPSPSPRYQDREG